MGPAGATPLHLVFLLDSIFLPVLRLKATLAAFSATLIGAGSLARGTDSRRSIRNKDGGGRGTRNGGCEQGGCDGKRGERAGQRAGAIGPHGAARADVQAGLFGPVGFPVRRHRVGATNSLDRVGEGRNDLRAEERRGAQVVVADGDEHRRPEVFPRPHRLTRARNLRPSAHRARGRHDHRSTAKRAATSAPAPTATPSTTSSPRSS